MKKLHLGQNILIACWAVLTVFFGLLSALALFPAETDVEIHETVRVTASRLNGETDVPPLYLLEASGTLRNTTAEAVTVDRLTIRIGDGEFSSDKIELKLDAVTVPAWAEVRISASEQSNVFCEYVGGITASVGGKEVYLRNPADTDLSAALVPVILTAVFAILLVRACKIRYYMAQEDRMDREKNVG